MTIRALEAVCIAFLFTLLLTTTGSAQDFRGAYVVIATEVFAEATESAATVRSIKLQYGDTVRVIDRESGDRYVIKMSDGKYFISQSAVVTIGRFIKNRPEPVSMDQVAPYSNRSFVVTIDSIQAMIGTDHWGA